MSVLFIFIMGIPASASLLRASETLSEYSGSIHNYTGTSITVYYDVIATGISDEVGVSSVVIKRTGDPSNSNVASFGSDYGTNRGSYSGSVTCTGEVGDTCYAVITCFAKQGNVTNYRTITTSTVTL